MLAQVCVCPPLFWQRPVLSSSACILGWTLADLFWNNPAVGRGSINIIQPGSTARHLEAAIPSKARLFSLLSLTSGSRRAGKESFCPKLWGACLMLAFCE